MSFLGLVGVASLKSSLLLAQHLPGPSRHSPPPAVNPLTASPYTNQSSITTAEFRPNIAPQSTYLSHLRLLGSAFPKATLAAETVLEPQKSFSSELASRSQYWLNTASTWLGRSSHTLKAETASSQRSPAADATVATRSKLGRLSNSNRVVPQWLGFLTNLMRMKQHEATEHPVPPTEVRVVRADFAKSLSDAADADKQQTTFWQCDWLAAEPPTARAVPHKDLFQVWVHGQLILEVTTREKAQQIADRIHHVLAEAEKFDPAGIKPTLVNQRPGGKAGDEVLFSVEEELASELHRSGTLLAIEWVNNLRAALGANPLEVSTAQAEMYGLTETNTSMEGTASWYGPYFHGRLTATGELFNQNALTAAHPSLPFDTYLKVTNLQNGDTVIVRINDRGPYVGERSLDLSREAARCLNSEEVGVIPYRAVIMHQASHSPSTPQTIAKR